MEEKPNETGQEGGPYSVFTSATRVQIPLGTQENQVVSGEAGAGAAGDRRGASSDPFSPTSDVPESEIDEALERIEGRRKSNGEMIEEDAELVALEVRRLRSELELKSRNSAEIALENVRLRDELHDARKDIASADANWDLLVAKLARVEALPKDWREPDLEWAGSAADAAADCAAELEAALKGE